MSAHGQVNSSDTISRELLNKLHQDAYVAGAHQCLLWIDPAQTDPFAGNSHVEAIRVRVPISHPHFDPLRAPYVVPLDLSCNADAELFTASVELAWVCWSKEYLEARRGQAICGWISADCDAKSLARHWARHCHVHVRQRQTKLLRFQDPGVREWLWPVLNEMQQRTLLGPASAIHAIGREQVLVEHRCTNDAATTTPALPLNLNQAQWDQVENYATLHAAWLAWRNYGQEDMAPLAPGWERSVHLALVQATRLGIHDVADRELFALHVLQLGSDFYQGPKLQDVWRKTQAGEFYGSALESVTGMPADQFGACPDARQQP